MTETAEGHVICGTCQVEPEVVTNADGEPEAVCPQCGQRDKTDDAVRIAQEYAVDAIGRGFQGMIGDAVKGNPSIKFTAERIPARNFRWHMAV